MKTVQEILQGAAAAKSAMALLSDEDRNRLLEAVAQSLLAQTDAILAANKQDIANAAGRISDVMIDRLRLTAERVQDMAAGVRAVKNLPSPLGQVENQYAHPKGLEISKIRVPIGVVAIIFESRPNVTSDAAALCIKSGNVCILRGGRDAILTNTQVVQAIREAFTQCHAPVDGVQLVEDTSHDSAAVLMQARGLVDLLIPRGGAGLIQAVVEGAKGVPVIETGTGICHIYVDKGADLDMALQIVHNAKTSRPSVCNAAEVCLVHKDVAEVFLPRLGQSLQSQVELRLDTRAGQIIEGTPATEADFHTEFLDYILAVAVVENIEQAILQINQNGTHHSDAIVTQDEAAAQAFQLQVDSAAVYVNASTRFTDGGEFGLGCEMGISTQKIGARGPMGLYELTSYKYVVQGQGQIR